MTRQNVTTLQPCSSYEWQAQRVPTRAYRPLLGWLFGSRTYDPRSSYRVPTTTYAYTTPRHLNSKPANSLWTDCAPGARILTPQDRYYAPGATTLGPNQGWEDVLDGDRPRPPAVSPGVEIPPTDYSKEADVDNVESENMNYQFSPREKAEPRSAFNQPLRSRRPRPIPDQDATFQSERPDPPQLIRPRVKTAVSRPAAGSFVLISWPERTANRVAPAVLREPASEQSRWRVPSTPNDQWEDDGWRSVR
jgi:hypothetical protein